MFHMSDYQHRIVHFHEDALVHIGDILDNGLIARWDGVCGRGPEYLSISHAPLTCFICIVEEQLEMQYPVMQNRNKCGHCGSVYDGKNECQLK